MKSSVEIRHRRFGLSGRKGKSWTAIPMREILSKITVLSSIRSLLTKKIDSNRWEKIPKIFALR